MNDPGVKRARGPAARGPVDLGDADRHERCPAPGPVRGRARCDGRVGVSGADALAMARWSWGSAASFSGIRKTRTMHSRRHSWSWCARPGRSGWASRWRPGSTPWPIGRLSGRRDRLAISLRRCSRNWRIPDGIVAPAMLATSTCGLCFTMSSIVCRASTGSRSCSVISKARPTRRPRGCCTGRSDRSAADSLADAIFCGRGSNGAAWTSRRRFLAVELAGRHANEVSTRPPDRIRPLAPRAGFADRQAFLSQFVALLTQGVLKTMFFNKIKLIAFVVLTRRRDGRRVPGLVLGHSSEAPHRRPGTLRPSNRIRLTNLKRSPTGRPRDRQPCEVCVKPGVSILGSARR